MFTFNKNTDFIEIIAPSSGCDLSIEKLNQSEKLLNSYGFKVSFNPDILVGDDLPFFAANKKIRLASLKEAILNPKIKIIWAFRGGYGCNEIIFDCLGLLPTTAKILIGYSDITALHLLFNQHYKMPSIHASVLTSLLDKQSGSLDSIIKALSGDLIHINITSINDILDKKLTGEVTGGNLTVFCNMIGTKLHPDTKGKILILEDVNESSYRVHRYLTHLKNSGVFDKVLAVIFADFTFSDQYINKTIEHFCNNNIGDIPTYRTIGIGHDRVNHPIIFGSIATINSKELTINNKFRLI